MARRRGCCDGCHSRYRGPCHLGGCGRFLGYAPAVASLHALLRGLHVGQPLAARARVGRQISDARLPADGVPRLLRDHLERQPRNPGCVVDVWRRHRQDPSRRWRRHPVVRGYSADHDGTEIADSCTSVPAIAAAYEKVITTYNVSRLDLDTEDRSLTRDAGIDRRNRAIALVEEWATRVHRLVQFVYTIPTNVAGIDPTSVHLLQNAVLHHARIDIVNIMTFDHYDDQPHEMANDTKTAAGHLIDTLHALYPQKSPEALWGMIGVTEMIGIDDFGPPEILTQADARDVRDWARARGIAELSFWALERDNGGCPGVAGSDSCSGLHQSTWRFTGIFSPFTHR